MNADNSGKTLVRFKDKQEKWEYIRDNLPGMIEFVKAFKERGIRFSSIEVYKRETINE